MSYCPWFKMSFMKGLTHIEWLNYYVSFKIVTRTVFCFSSLTDFTCVGKELAVSTNASTFLTQSLILAYFSLSESSVLNVISLKRKIIDAVRDGKNAFINEPVKSTPTLAKRMMTVLTLTLKLIYAVLVLIFTVLTTPVISCSIFILSVMTVLVLMLCQN